jgi:hypothetical protein
MEERGAFLASLSLGNRGSEGLSRGQKMGKEEGDQFK